MKNNRSEEKGANRQEFQYPSEFYEIMVQGYLDSLWEQWFEGMTFSNVENREIGMACTLITGPVADQSVLHGLLIKIRDLNLKLISVRRISPKTKTSEEINFDLT